MIYGSPHPGVETEIEQPAPRSSHPEAKSCKLPHSHLLHYPSWKFSTACIRWKKLSRPDAAALTTFWWPPSATMPDIEQLVALCRQLGVRVRQESREQLTQLAQTPAHQGVVAFVHPQESLSIEDLFAPDPAAKSGVARLLLALDGVEDPQNLGALLRVADGAGVDGVVLTERRSAPLSPVAVKASAGAAEHLRIARVVNLVRALEELKRQNLWIIGLDERGTSDYDQFDLTGDCVLVLGREGAGLHDLVRRTCDHLLRIPMAGGVSSLNVSAAGAVVLYEAFRQRRINAGSKGAFSSAAAAASKPKKQKGLGS